MPLRDVLYKWTCFLGIGIHTFCHDSVKHCCCGRISGSPKRVDCRDVSARLQ